MLLQDCCFKLISSSALFSNPGPSNPQTLSTSSFSPSDPRPPTSVLPSSVLCHLSFDICLLSSIPREMHVHDERSLPRRFGKSYWGVFHWGVFRPLSSDFRPLTSVLMETLKIPSLFSNQLRFFKPSNTRRHNPSAIQISFLSIILSNTIRTSSRDNICLW